MLLYISLIPLFIIAFLLLVKLYRIKTNKSAESRPDPSENYLNAKEIFVRDPEAFRDKDRDGIDDIIDKEIK